MICDAKASRGSRRDLQGGLQVCLDMSRAFDKVQRPLVEASIRAAGFSKETETFVLIWLQGGEYTLVQLSPAAEE